MTLQVVAWRRRPVAIPPRPPKVPYRADRGPLTDEYLAKVAAQFAWLQAYAHGTSAYVGVARQAEVSVAAVNKWVIECRRRGLLPPTRRTRV